VESQRREEQETEETEGNTEEHKNTIAVSQSSASLGLKLAVVAGVQFLGRLLQISCRSVPNHCCLVLRYHKAEAWHWPRRKSFPMLHGLGVVLMVPRGASCYNQ